MHQQQWWYQNKGTQQQRQLLLHQTDSEVDEASTMPADSSDRPGWRALLRLSEDAESDGVNQPKDGDHAYGPDGMRPWRFFVAVAAVVSFVGGLVTVAYVSGLAAEPLARRWAAAVGGELRRSELLLGIPAGTTVNNPELLSLVAKVPQATCSGRVEDLEYMADGPVWHRHVDHVDSPDRCCALCTYFKQCQTWTWVRDAKLVTGCPSQCWLKGGTSGRKVHKAGVVSGLRRRPQPQRPPQVSAPKAKAKKTSSWRFCPKVMPPLVPPQHCSKVEEHTDYVDEHPWKWHVDHVPSPGDCCSLCSHFPECRAWSWVEDAKLKIGCPAQCWLKGLVGHVPKKSIAKQGVISGLRAVDAKPTQPVAFTTDEPKATISRGPPWPNSSSKASETSAGSNTTDENDIFKDIEWPTYAKTVIEGALKGKTGAETNASAVVVQVDERGANKSSAAVGVSRSTEPPVRQRSSTVAPVASSTVAPAVFMVPDGTDAEDAVAAAALAAQAAPTTAASKTSGPATTRQAPQQPKELTFYMYRATGEFAPPLENVNAADLAGVMLYLHREVVATTPRKFGIDRIRRYRVTVKNTLELFNVHHSSLGPYLAFEGGQCTSPLCGRVFRHYGYIVGCQLLEDSASAYEATTATAPGKCESKSKCHLPVWYSLPGPCPIQRGMYRKRRLTGRKLQSCEQQTPGGKCKMATGKSDCTYSVEEAGYVLLDELLGISDYASWCRDGNKEYDQRLDRGKGTRFWDGHQDSAKCSTRMAAVKALFKRRYPKLPEHLHEPPCDFDMYYKGEFSWPVNHTGNRDI